MRKLLGCARGRALLQRVVMRYVPGVAWEREKDTEGFIRLMRANAVHGVVARALRVVGVQSPVWLRLSVQYEERQVKGMLRQSGSSALQPEYENTTASLRLLFNTNDLGRPGCYGSAEALPSSRGRGENSLIGLSRIWLGRSSLR